MATTHVNVRRAEAKPAWEGFGRAVGVGAPAFPAELEADLHRVRTLANWLDSKFSVAGIRFGFDSIIGLVPGVGDVFTGLVGAYPIYVARRHGLGKLLQARMAGNVLIDMAVGTVPLLGDVFDVGFKAATKNLALLERAAEKRRQRAG